MADEASGSESLDKSKQRRSREERLLFRRLELKSRGAMPIKARRPRRVPGERLLKERLKNPDKIVKAEEEPTPAKVKKSTSVETSASDVLLCLFIWTRRLIRLIVYGYVLALLAVVVGMRIWGETNLTSVALMYVPPLVWIVPAFFLFPVSLIAGWRTALLVLILIPTYLIGHMRWELNAVTAPVDPKNMHTLRLMTWNRGQSKGVSLQPIKNQWRPDFIALQDAAGTERYYKGNENYAEFPHTVSSGEFVFLSRWPIISAEPLAPSKKLSRSGHPIYRAARFVVAAMGQRCVIYTVHLESPRDALSTYRSGAFLWGIVGFPGSPWETKKLYYQSFWDEQLRVARVIAERSRADFGPVIVAGDFNSPAYGPMDKMFEETLNDAHRSAGDGYGNTFPGVTNNPLALFQPWMRLDRIYFSEHCLPISCHIVPEKAQHLPVISEFAWRLSAPETLPER